MNTKTIKHILLDKLAWFITGFLLLSLLGAWFLIPSFQGFLKEAFEILTSGNRDKISQWVQQFGFWGPLVIVFAMVLQMFTLVINSVLLLLIAILAYGKIWGSLLGLLSVLVASTVGYFLGQLIGEPAINKILGEKTKDAVYEKVDKYGIWAVVIARISPFLSNDAISFITGFTKMNYLKFILATIAGISPLILLIAWLGEDWERLKTTLLWVSIVSLVAFGIYLFFQYRKKKA